jgi:hypothetical protein
MSNASLSKYRWQSYTKGENAEVLIAGAQAYTSQSTYPLFQANAADGEVGIFDAVTMAALAANGVLGTVKNLVGSTATGAGLITANTYYYTIVPINAAGHGLPGNEISITTTTSTSTNTLSWDAVPGAVSYQIWRGTTAGAEGNFQTSVTNSFTDTSAAGGTSGTLPTTNTATIGVAQALIAGQKYFVAQRRDSRCKTTTAIIYDSSRTRRVPYAAPVKQITTITIDTSLYTYVAGDNPEIALIETTPGNEPWPTWAYDVVQGTIVGGTAITTLALALQAIVDRINNVADLVHRDDVLNGVTPFTAALSNSGSVYTVTITAGFFGEHFKVALRGNLSGLGVVATPTPFVLGSGFYDHVLSLEKEGWIYEGVTTNYPGDGVTPADFGYPTSYVVNGLTYNIYHIDPRRVSAEPNAVNERVHYPHIYVITPVPVGGSTSLRAASSPDYAIGTILGFPLSA